MFDTYLLFAFLSNKFVMNIAIFSTQIELAFNCFFIHVKSIKSNLISITWNSPNTHQIIKDMNV